MAFYEGDVNGDQKLSFEEFVNIVPTEMRESASDHDLRGLFCSVDADGSGSITVRESPAPLCLLQTC